MSKASIENSITNIICIYNIKDKSSVFIFKVASPVVDKGSAGAVLNSSMETVGCSQAAALQIYQKLLVNYLKSKGLNLNHETK